MINDIRFQHEIKSRFSMTKAAFHKKKKTLFISRAQSNLRKKLVKCYIWSICMVL